AQSARPGAPRSPRGVWKIDPSHTQIGFSIKHLGISSVQGLFTDYAGTATIGPDLDSTSVELTAKTTSVDTGNTGRDEHLRGDHFFDCEHFPEMTFRSTSVAAAGGSFSLVGDLTIK